MAKQGDSLSVGVAHDLLQRIIADEFPSGSSMPSERDLQERYGVSRTVVREALKVLLSRGLISMNGRQRAVVGGDLTSPASDALVLAFHRSHVCVDDLLGTRLLLEPLIAGLAAQHATPVQTRRLTALSATLEQVPGEGGEERVSDELRLDIDVRFHILLAEASQNPVLGILIEVLVGIVWRHRRAVKLSFTEEHRAQIIAQHSAIAQAVAARDPEQARQAMIAHLEYTRHYLAAREDSLQELVEDLL